MFQLPPKTTTTLGVILALLLVVGVISFASERLSSTQITYPEIEELQATPGQSFQELSKYFRELSDTKGAPYAFEVLKRANLPPGTDLHLLGHVVGDILYEQQGIEGIYVCTPDFRNACSHSVVVGMLLDEGASALGKIADTCKKAPGGRGAYTMCFHGLGHGALAFNEYHFEKAIEMCRKTGTAEYQYREYIECVGGATMEMIAGVHDREAWKLQKDVYFKKSDPLYPCSAPFMPQEVQSICYVHLTPYLFERAGLDLGAPDPSHYPKAFSFCDAIPVDEVQNRISCYGGFGKEFVGLAQARDIRDIGSMQEPALQNIRSWCALAGNDAGEKDCTLYALGSLFWGGENNPDASFRYCSILEGELSRACYEHLAFNISTFHHGSLKGRELCSRLPEPYRPLCRPQTQ